MNYHTFLPQFHPLILDGSKTTTIRGSTRVKPGERFALRHWTARPYGSPMGFLGTALCVDVHGVSLYPEACATTHGATGNITNRPHQLDAVARVDGFPSWTALVEHFGKRLPFHGVRIVWRDFVAGAP